MARKFLKFTQDPRGWLFISNAKGDDMGNIQQEKVGRKVRWVYVLPIVEVYETVYHTPSCLREIADKIDEIEKEASKWVDAPWE